MKMLFAGREFLFSGQGRFFGGGRAEVGVA